MKRRGGRGRPARPPRAAAPPTITGERWAGVRRRPRRFDSLDGRARRRGRRLRQLALLLAELAALITLLLVPAFHIHHVQVTGNQRLSASQVVDAAGLQQPGSIFLLDGGAVERRLDASAWVRQASVSAELPDRVSIRVEEWQPVAVYRAAGGTPWYLSDQAVALGPAGGSGALGLLELDGPARPAPRQGSQPIDRALLVALVNIQRALPRLIGQPVRSFTLDSCGNLTMTATRGWQVQFGRVLTPEEFASLGDKVASLKALQSAGIDFGSPSLQYVNVMNPADVAVKQQGAPPRPVRPGRSPSPTSSQARQPPATACQ